jgi:TPR repeat protein
MQTTSPSLAAFEEKVANQDKSHADELYRALSLLGDESHKSNQFKAIAAIRDLAESKRYAPAMIQLARCFAHGTGVDKNLARAREYYLLADERVDAEAQVEVDEFIGTSYELGIGCALEMNQAEKYLRRAAEKNSAAAMLNLSVVLFKRKQDKDKEALEWLKKSAELGFPQAFEFLGRVYTYGLYGIPKDLDKGGEYYLRASMLNVTLFSETISTLAQFFESRCSNDNDESNAVYWMKKLKHEYWSSAKHFASGMMATSAKRLLKKIHSMSDSKDCYIPELKDWPEAIVQHGPNCGIYAFVIAANHSKILPQKLFARKKDLPKDSKGKASNDEMKSDEMKSVRFIVKQKFKTVGPIYTVDWLTELANEMKLPGCKALQPMADEIEYTSTIISHLKNHETIVASCDVSESMPKEINGHGTHWAAIFGYFYSKDRCYFLVTHHGKYCIWSAEDLYKCNKQLPDENPKFETLVFSKSKTSGEYEELTIDKSVDDKILKAAYHIPFGSLRRFKGTLFCVPQKQNNELDPKKNTGVLRCA